MEKKNEKKSGSKLKAIGMFLLATAVCFALGLLFGKLFGKPGGDGVQRTSGEKIAYLVTLFVSLFVSYILTLILHEGGHLVFGMATGYEFLSFRVFSLTLVKKDGKFAWKRFSIKGTGGQCILMPPESDTPEKVPFFLYHAGGGFMNFITAAICLPISGVISSEIPRTFLLVLGLLSVIQGFVNLIPMKIQIPNDGYNIMMMLKDPAEKVAIYKSLRINGLLYYGKTPSEIPEELFDLGSNGFYKTVAKVLRAGVLLDRHEYAEAEVLYAECAEDDTIKVYQLESRCELLFCKIMNGAPAEEIDDICTSTTPKQPGRNTTPR